MKSAAFLSELIADEHRSINLSLIIRNININAGKLQANSSTTSLHTCLFGKIYDRTYPIPLQSFFQISNKPDTPHVHVQPILGTHN